MQQIWYAYLEPIGNQPGSLLAGMLICFAVIACAILAALAAPQGSVKKSGPMPDEPANSRLRLVKKGMFGNHKGS